MITVQGGREQVIGRQHAGVLVWHRLQGSRGQHGGRVPLQRRCALYRCSVVQALQLCCQLPQLLCHWCHLRCQLPQLPCHRCHLRYQLPQLR